MFSANWISSFKSDSNHLKQIKAVARCCQQHPKIGRKSHK